MSRASSKPLLSALPPILFASLAGCWASSPCDPGQTVVQDLCVPAAQSSADSGAAAASPDAGAEASAGRASDAAPADNFGAACSKSADCAGGAAPVCAAPTLPYCTQIDCSAGQANAGVCPSGFECLSGPNGSACVKQ